MDAMGYEWTPKKNPKTQTVHLRSYLERETNPKPSARNGIISPIHDFGEEWPHFHKGKWASHAPNKSGNGIRPNKFGEKNRPNQRVCLKLKYIHAYIYIYINIYKHLTCYSTYQGNACCG